ncbi:hypothetical protein CABS01_15423 [Colletotrichum abscissum]|uniref:uncharacterized protein n=1 Tax=Colletotrichum abscissum TaxID=1671311 RepID=UPI0027D4B148|nr:uncharacterized protein CABS01_15423 [Colletotrichum abscissum]KAK1476421.1 hypothetical protein CABS01_15423 [Colletotrichum abscissum]
MPGTCVPVLLSPFFHFGTFHHPVPSPPKSPPTAPASAGRDFLTRTELGQPSVETTIWRHPSVSFGGKTSVFLQFLCRLLPPLSFGLQSIEGAVATG